MTTLCSHTFIDPDEAPINQAPYSPILGPGRREMKAGVTYVCRECGMTCRFPIVDAPKQAVFRTTEGRSVVLDEDIAELHRRAYENGADVPPPPTKVTT